MSKNRKKQNAKREPDAWVSLSVSITLFVLSIILLYKPDYFANITIIFSWVLIAIGVFILGISLSIVDEQAPYKEMMYDKYGFIGAGVAFLIIWHLVYKNQTLVWVNVIIFPVLFFGIYAIVLGGINIVRHLMNRTINKNNTSKDKVIHSPAVKFINGFAWLLGLVASLLQVLQYFKLIP